MINTETDEVREFQLKATNYKSYLNKHIKKYENIDVLATEEIAGGDRNIGSTGFYNKDLREEVEDTLDKVEDPIGSEVLSSMTVSAMIILARKLKVILKGGKMTNDEKSKLVQDVKVAAGVAGVISLLIG